MHAEARRTFAHLIPNLESPRGFPGGVHIVAIDTETCALGRGKDRIVQFCAVELDGELRQRSMWTELVNPGRPIPPGATAIHGITNAMVRDAPPFGHFAPRLRGLIREETVFMAYNAGFDMGVLNLEFARAKVPVIPVGQPVLDPLQIERRVLSRSLGPTYRRYTGQPLANAHRADADTLAMVEVLRRQRAAHADLLPPTVEELVDWPSATPHGERPRRRSHLYRDLDGTVRLGFGKHRDRAAHEVPDYIVWMLGQDFPESTKRRAREVLQQATAAAG